MCRGSGGTVDLTLKLEAAEGSRPGNLDDFARQLRRSRVVLAKDVQSDSTRPGLYHWTISDVAPGQYVLRSVGLTIAKFIEIGSENCRDLELVIPPPADVELKLFCLDTEDLTLPREIEVVWNCRPPPAPFQAVETRPARWDQATASYRFRAPIGVVEISLETDEFEIAGSDELAVRSGSNRFSLRARRSRP